MSSEADNKSSAAIEKFTSSLYLLRGASIGLSIICDYWKERDANGTSVVNMMRHGWNGNEGV